MKEAVSLWSNITDLQQRNLERVEQVKERMGKVWCLHPANKVKKLRKPRNTGK